MVTQDASQDGGALADYVGLHRIEAGVVQDPWLLRCALEDYCVCDTSPDARDDGAVLDALLCSSASAGDARERARERTRMVVAMGRYGHQDMRGWDDVELLEFLALYRELAVLVKAENAIQSSVENGG